MRLFHAGIMRAYIDSHNRMRVFPRSRDAVERVGQQEGLLGVAAGKV